MARGDYEDAIEYFNSYIELDIPQEDIDNVKKLIDKIEKIKNEK